MSFNHYYQSELTALRELGRRFAERSPALAPFLGQPGQDPDVERLLEGFAFLTGRLRQKLDDELPELSHSLMHLLWPNYMRPLPAFSMVQFDALTEPGPVRKIARGTPIASEPVNGVVCQFQTCYPTDVLPLALSGLTYSVKGDGALLSLRLAMSASGHLGQLSLRRLRLHFAGERYISQMLYLLTLRNLQGIEVVPHDSDGKPLERAGGGPIVLRIGAGCIQPVGFAEDEALIPYPLNTFRGYRYLQEYFAFQDKFLFVDVTGLEVLGSLPEDILKQARGLEMRFDIRKNGIERLRPTLDNVRLYCTPVANLFRHDAQPIRLDNREDDYPVLPMTLNRQDCGIFCVETVTSCGIGPGRQRHYVPFESFEHDPSFDVPDSRPHYSIRQRPSLQDEGLDTYLSVGVRDSQASEVLSIELMCTNQNLPRQLGIGQICNMHQGSSGAVSVRNIVPATASYAPPLTRNFLWKLISNMSLNYLSLADVNALKVILETYDLPSYHDRHAQKVSQRLLGGLKSVRHHHVDRLYRGLPVRGLRTELSIDPQGYIGEGDLFVFASVLNEFFALYASLNSYHELKVLSTKGEVYQWTPRMGQQPLL